jgi:DNA-binding beta-propeller fold protein YncE
VRTRRLIGVATLLALLAILAGVSGFELPFGAPGQGAERPVPGVRAVGSDVLLRVGSGAPPGGELAFLAVEPGGGLFVSDARRQTVMRFDPTGHLLSEWGPRLGNLSLSEPAGVAVSGDRFYVVDRGTPRILRLDGAGRLQATINLAPFNTYGLNGLSVDASGNVYAADTGRNRLLVFSPGGQLIKQVGRGGNDLGAFTQPMMLAFAPDASFFVADWENSRVERWSPDFQAIDAWSTGFRPFGVAVDQLGRVFVPDTEGRRIEAYSARGAALGDLGAAGSGAAVAFAPKQVAVARSAAPSVYVLGGDGIQRIDIENTAPPQTSSDVDPLSLLVLAAMLAVVVVAVGSRRRRRGAALLRPTLDRPVRLDAENGAERQHQQARPDEDLLIAHQPEREQ